MKQSNWDSGLSHHSTILAQNIDVSVVSLRINAVSHDRNISEQGINEGREGLK